MIQLQAAGHVRYRSEKHGGVIMLDTTSGEWLALNATAGDLWRCWDAGTGFDDGVAVVAARYPQIHPESIRADAERLLEEFVTRGLMEATPPPVAAGVAMAEPGYAGAHSSGMLRLGIAYICIVLASALLLCSSGFRSLSCAHATGACARDQLTCELPAARLPRSAALPAASRAGRRAWNSPSPPFCSPLCSGASSPGVSGPRQTRIASTPGSK